MDPRYIKDYVLCSKIIKERPEIVINISTLLASQLLLTPKTEQRQISRAAEKELVIVGGAGNPAAKSVIRYNPTNKDFINCTTPPSFCIASAVAVYNNKVNFV